MKSCQHLDCSVLKPWAPEAEARLDELLAAEISAHPAKIIVLDDDPTGVQTVHGISVYTGWDSQAISEGFAEPQKAFYILTNSRGMTAEQSEAIHREIAARVAAEGKRNNRGWIFMSRSDSTLRGHYPLETAILAEENAKNGLVADGEIICPFFREGGRYTIDDVHYVRYGDTLVPAGETEFAKDKTFGYAASNLCDYVEEKTGGAFKASDVTSIKLEDLRQENFDKIESQLMAVRDFGKIIVNAMDYGDLKAFAIPLYRAMAKGKNFVFRTAAALVKVLAGIPDKPLLSKEEMLAERSPAGGMIVVGSHTNKTTAQLKRLLELDNVKGLEFNSDLVLNSDEALASEVDRVVAECESLIGQGITPVCYTKRQLISLPNDTREQALLRSIKISDAVQSLVKNLRVKPSFVLAKGGITSSDVGVKALGVKRATVLGQIQPGIPVWQTDAQSKFPGIPYIIFPGNVGEEGTLKDAVTILLG